jgi:hypothetical protein
MDRCVIEKRHVAQTISPTTSAATAGRRFSPKAKTTIASAGTMPTSRSRR